MAFVQDQLRVKDSIYTKTARFDDQERALTDEELFQLAPSIFATEAHSSRSDRFAPIPTIDVLRKIAEEGFYPVGAKQSTARDPVKALFTKHLIRLRKLDGKVRKVGDSVFELMLKNANDGTARYNLMGGLWRIRCANSLVSHEKTIEEIAIRHTGDAAIGVLEASMKLLDQSEKVLATAERWGRIDMNEFERFDFAKKAHAMRFEGKNYGVATAVQPDRLLEARRAGDKGTDLWTTFNVVQENIIKGGQEGEGQDGKGKACRYKSRPVNSIDADVTMNTRLWGLADEWATQRAVLV
jgi:hypothetical protein